MRVLILAIACFFFVAGPVLAADPFPSSSCTGLTGADLVQCQALVAISAQLAASQVSIDGVAGLAGSLSIPLTALSSLWTEEGAYFFLGVCLALVFVRAVGTRW
jgi:hypothetical protein